MKIFSPYPPAVNAALAENLGKPEFVESPSNADITLPKLPLPVRIGEILDFIANENAKPIINSLRIDTARKTITTADNSILLTEKEAEIIAFLLATPRPVSREEMISQIWKYAETADTNTVESHIYRLRQKISEAFGTEIIITENGSYRLS